MSRGRRKALKRASARRSYVKTLRRSRRAAARSAAIAAATALSVTAWPASQGAEPSTFELIAQMPTGPMVVMDGTLYFAANDGIHGLELWKSDGTAAGTTLVADIRPGPDSSDPSYLTAVDDRLFFEAANRTHNYEMWTSDGTTAGTVLLKDITLDEDRYTAWPYNVTAAGGRVYFTQEGRLWQSNGTTAGTKVVEDSTGAEIYSSAGDTVTEADGTVYFGYRGADDEFGLWRSDGTAAGTMPVRKFGSEIPSGVTPVASEDGLFVIVGHYRRGTDLWTSDGTSAGTTLVKKFPVGTGWEDGITAWAVRGDELFFGADDGVHGHELWRSDGTASGTVMVRNITPGAGDTEIDSMTVAGGQVFFAEGQFVGGHGSLWTSDGSRPGTFRLPVDTVDCGTWCRPVSHITAVGDVVYFGAMDTRGRELWRSDGTTAGTELVQDFNPGPASSLSEFDAPIIDFLGSPFVTADDGDHGPSLWKLIDTPSSPSCLGRPATITGSGTITGTAGPDVIVGSSADDVIDGRGGDDLICGGDGEDRILQGIKDDGSDRVEGGGGVDSISYASRTTPVHVTLNLPTADDGAAGEADTVVGVENLLGGSAADTLVGSNAANVLNGGAGKDAIDGGAGADVAKGGADGDVLLQGDSQDGADLLDGGTGYDEVSYEQRQVSISVTLGAHTPGDDGAVNGENDTVVAVENALGGYGDDRLSGTTGPNRLIGRDGDDVIIGAGGADTGKGGDGKDRFVESRAANGADVLDGGWGIDTVRYASRSAPVTVTLKNSTGSDDGENGEGDRLVDVENAVGGRGDDVLRGSNVANVVSGGPGNDAIDLLDGTAGNDRGNGDTGTDTATADPGDIITGVP